MFKTGADDIPDRRRMRLLFQGDRWLRRWWVASGAWGRGSSDHACRNGSQSPSTGTKTKYTSFELRSACHFDINVFIKGCWYEFKIILGSKIFITSKAYTPVNTRSIMRPMGRLSSKVFITSSIISLEMPTPLGPATVLFTSCKCQSWRKHDDSL